MQKYLILMFFGFLCIQSFNAAAQPWKSPLMITHSTDGITFDPPVIFQDSSGVPSMIRWHGDTLIAAFQWFRLPNPSPSWDRVAVKFSYDNGLTWTSPVPIVVNGLPATYQRPFDPALTTFTNDSIRIYFSSSDGFPPLGIDSTVNTYSATSIDGIHYEFEITPRVDIDSNRVIDPSVIYFNTGWHYASPVGAPQEGAYHYVSPDGFNFNAVPVIPSDNMHNWTGNYMVESNTELRFYGTAPTNIWYNASPNGGMWTGYVNTNIHGGDPSALKVAAGNYLMVFVGPQYPNAVDDLSGSNNLLLLYPNPSDGIIYLRTNKNCHADFTILDAFGRHVGGGKLINEINPIDIHSFAKGVYIIQVAAQGYFKFVKE